MHESDSSQDCADDIANLCFAKYQSLPLSYKTQPRPNGVPQYSILAGIVLSRPVEPTSPEDSRNPSTKADRMLKCVSIATGSKCLPASKMPIGGDLLHDCHAEVLVRRGLVHWVYDEIGRTMCPNFRSGSATLWIEEIESQYSKLKSDNGSSRQFRLTAGVKVHLYISTLPCGDASTLSLSLAQLKENPDMAKSKSNGNCPTSSEALLSRGRNGYSTYGILRTKPGRSDAESTMSMSCSDKIASWTVTGLQGALLSHIMEPIYVDELVIGEVPDELRDDMRAECRRAFDCRLKVGPVDADLIPPFQRRPPHVSLTSQPFIYSKTQVPKAAVAATECIVWIADADDKPEALTGGLKRGADLKALVTSAKTRSRLCKASLFHLHCNTLQLLGKSDIIPSSSMTYFEAKQAMRAYQDVKRMLRQSSGPFNGWIASGQCWEAFTRL